MTAAVKRIIRSIDEHPEQWWTDDDANVLTHRTCDLRLWISYGLLFYGVLHNGKIVNLGFFDGLRFSRALKRWWAKQPDDPPVEIKLTLDDCAALLDQVEAS